jgi:hypothetical protein
MKRLLIVKPKVKGRKVDQECNGWMEDVEKDLRNLGVVI